ncbi:hypothetical protein C8J55DRAFT_480655 [Lentinula edodes]|uniref:GATA-type domain-containing protein n=1 Tax=Lentinula lateritia TaxID=40482 RepID=A0A9W8ZV05_9AGAR|nr:hypothetical protein C8J55DRAFT_480655 [Lentinula edodes]
MELRKVLLPNSISVFAPSKNQSSPMHGNTRQDTLFAFDEGQFAFTTQSYPGRSYSSASSSSSEYWNYTSSSSSYPSYSGSLSYGSSQKPSRSWSNDSGPGIEPSFPRHVNSYDASLRSTDMRQHSIYNSNVNLWSPPQLSSQWSNTGVPDQSWRNMSMPGIDSFEETKPIIHHNHVSVSSCSPLSTISSPSPSPSPIHTTLNTTPKLGRRPSATGTAKVCAHCHATSTPLWRREPATLRTLCNACGLYLQQRNKLRPQELIDADGDDESESSSEHDGTGPECSHCHTHHTSVWRRSKTGAQLCNACGVYVRLRGKDRPLSLKRNKIKPRTKHPKPSPELEKHS